MATGKKRGRPKGSKSSYNMTSQALAKRREQLNVYPARTDEEKEYNARLIEHTIRIQEISTHADRKDPMSLRSCFIAYMKLCQEDGFRVGNFGACASMGYAPNALTQWAQSSNPELQELSRFVRTCCALTREQAISDNKLNPVIGIFWQRNFDGLRNDTEQQQIVENTDGIDKKSASDYIKQYGKLLEE